MRWTTATQQCMSDVGGTSFFVCAGECSNAQCYVVRRLSVVMTCMAQVANAVSRQVAERQVT